MLTLRCPDATEREVSSRKVYGRFAGGGLAEEAAASKQQFAVEAVEGAACITNLGQNALVVETASPDTVPQSWELRDLLDKGMSAVVGANSRFFLASRQSSTTFHVLEAMRGQPTALQHAANTGEAERPAKRQRVDAVHKEADAMPFALMAVRGLQHRGAPGVALKDVVCGNMQWVLVSNYMIDLRWLLSACPALATQADALIIAHGEPDYRAEAMKRDAALAGLRDCILHAPPLPVPWGTHHSKAFVILYSRGVRVIVHTANLIYADCNTKTQGLWFQDFPVKDGQAPATSPFQQELSAYLSSLKLPKAAADKALSICQQHDFSAARVHLIVSQPGYHSGPAAQRYGHMKVRALLNKERFDSCFKGAPIVAQFSSLGSLEERWLMEEFLTSLSGGVCKPDAAATSTTVGGRLGPPPVGPRGLQLIWPTVEEVRNSLEGWPAGNSIPGPAKNVERPYLQPYWHRWGGEAAGLQRAMPHIKSYTRYTREGRLAWFLLGSHNMSKAAWGSLQKQGQQLMIRSYELSVLFLPSSEAAYQSSRHRGFSCTADDPVASTGATAGDEEVQFVALGAEEPAPAAASKLVRLAMPVPYLLPPRRYEAGERPWTWDGNHAGLDVLGRKFGERVSMYGLLEAD